MSCHVATSLGTGFGAQLRLAQASAAIQRQFFCLQLECLPAQSPPSESFSFGSKTEARAAGGWLTLNLFCQQSAWVWSTQKKADYNAWS